MTARKWTTLPNSCANKESNNLLELMLADIVKLYEANRVDGLKDWLSNIFHKSVDSGDLSSQHLIHHLLLSSLHKLHQREITQRSKTKENTTYPKYLNITKILLEFRTDMLHSNGRGQSAVFLSYLASLTRPVRYKDAITELHQSITYKTSQYLTRTTSSPVTNRRIYRTNTARQRRAPISVDDLFTLIGNTGIYRGISGQHNSSTAELPPIKINATG